MMTTNTELQPAAPAVAGPSAHAAEVKLGEIRGDRMCLACGFNLHGQTIVREPHYGILIVRCPECAGVSGLQEYPVLGVWGKRWGLVLAAAYVLLIVAGLLASGIASGAFSVAMHQEVLRDRGRAVANAHREWFNETGQAAKIAAANPNPSGALQAQISQTVGSVTRGDFRAAVMQSWWEAEGRAGAANWYRPAGQRAEIHPEFVLVSAVVGMAAILGGGVLGVLVCGLRGWKLLLVPAIIWGIGALVAWPVMRIMISELDASGWSRGWLPGFATSGLLAAEMSSPFIWAAVLGGVAGCVSVGCLLGRPVARLVVGTMLPRRSAMALSVLWEADGKRFPRAKTGESPRNTENLETV